MMIAGFEAPTRGEIFISDRRVTRLRANRRNFGVVFQSYTLFPHMTVRDNIGFPLRMRGVGRAAIDAQVAEALALVQLDGYGDRLPAELSGGQQQRIAIARAVVFKPPVLLMDEPLGALDRRLREDMQIEIKRLHRQLGMTIVYVTHDQEEALSMADRIAVMRSGTARTDRHATTALSCAGDMVRRGFSRPDEFPAGIVAELAMAETAASIWQPAAVSTSAGIPVSSRRLVSGPGSASGRSAFVSMMLAIPPACCAARWWRRFMPGARRWSMSNSGRARRFVRGSRQSAAARRSRWATRSRSHGRPGMRMCFLMRNSGRDGRIAMQP